VADLTIETIEGGQRFTVRQGKWTPLWALLVLLAATAALAGGAAWLFIAGSWSLGLALGAAALLSGGVTLLLCIPLLLVVLTVPEKSVFSVTSEAIALEAKGSAKDPDSIAASTILSIHQGTPRASSGVDIGLAGDIAGLAGLVLSRRGSAVWVTTRERSIYLARQIRKEEAAEVFRAIKSTVRFGQDA
jgi:hypothetical protein